MPPHPTHRICHVSWELIQTFRGAVIPRAGETLVLEKDGQETKYRVADVMYKQAADGELVATVFVRPV